jgi:hypothetical protein
VRTIFPADEGGVEVCELDEAEGRELFDQTARKALGISGPEFLRRYDSGEYGCGTGRCAEAHHLIMLIPFAR